MLDSRRDGCVSLLDLLFGGQSWRHEESDDGRDLVLDKLDTVRDGVSDSREDLLELVLALDVSDSDLVNQRGSALELGVVNAVRP